MAFHYLIDFENVHEDGLHGISRLKPEDAVYLFYTINANRISLDVFANGIPSKLEVIRIVAGKQSLDMHLNSFLGYLIGKSIREKTTTNAGIPINPDLARANDEDKFVIVSRDLDYSDTIHFWNRRLGDTRVLWQPSIEGDPVPPPMRPIMSKPIKLKKRPKTKPVGKPFPAAAQAPVQVTAPENPPVPTAATQEAHAESANPAIQAPVAPNPVQTESVPQTAPAAEHEKALPTVPAHSEIQQPKQEDTHVTAPSAPEKKEAPASKEPVHAQTPALQNAKEQAPKAEEKKPEQPADTPKTPAASQAPKDEKKPFTPKPPIPRRQVQAPSLQEKAQGKTEGARPEKGSSEKHAAPAPENSQKPQQHAESSEKESPAPVKVSEPAAPDATINVQDKAAPAAPEAPAKTETQAKPEPQAPQVQKKPPVQGKPADKPAPAPRPQQNQSKPAPKNQAKQPPKPLNEKAQLNVRVQKKMSEAKLPNDIISFCASTAVKHMGEPSGKQALYRDLVHQYGRAKGSEYYQIMKPVLWETAVDVQKAKKATDTAAT
ncbi:MAG: hypothetical protein IJ083_16435 [Clostridia bacterium]|nr:hypothetical protein [Clostridia bacterium]